MAMLVTVPASSPLTSSYSSDSDTNIPSSAAFPALLPLHDLHKGKAPLSVDALLPILVNCIDSRNITQANHGHCLFCSYGLEDQVANYVVPMYVFCGSVLDAERAFVKNPELCNDHSWTVLIQGFVGSGNSSRAIDLYRNMMESSVNPSVHTLVAVLKACTKENLMERGCELHAEITKLGLEGHLFLGNTLVRLYARCGTMQELQCVFSLLQVKDVASWNALLAGYSDNGWIEEIVVAIGDMESQGVSPNCITYTCGVKACCSSSSEEILKIGQALHLDITKRGIETDDLLRSNLVIMYANFGELLEAHKLFGELGVDDGMASGALMAGYLEKGLLKEVLEFPVQVSDVFACASSLKIYGIMDAREKGMELHSVLVKLGYDDDTFLESGLVGMYTKWNLLLDAEKVFDRMSPRDNVCWTALISGYAENGLAKKALLCFDQMQIEHLAPCAASFACTLKACCSTPNISRGRDLHVEIIKRGFEKDSFIGSTLVDLYCKCGFMEDARQIYDNLEVHESVTCTALLTGYVEHGFGDEALACLDSMQEEGMCPDIIMLVASLKACAGTGAVCQGREIHIEVAKRGLDQEYMIGVGLVDMYGKCRCLTDANMVFSKLADQDLVSWNAMIAGHAAYGLLEVALSLLQEMQLARISPDIVSWNSLIMGYAEQGASTEAYRFFLQMQAQGMLPTDVVFLSVLKACGNMSAMQIGKRIHVHVCGWSGGVISSESSVSTLLIEMYSKCGSMEYAHELFKSFTAVHIRMWDVLIRGYAQQGDSEVVLELLQKMTAEGIPPDDILFLNVLNVSAHMGLVEVGQSCYNTMTREYGIRPSFKHQTCMVSLLCRAGQLEEAALLIKQMPSSPNLVVWSCMLDACQKWRNVELGRWAFDHAILLRDLDSSPFTLMSHMYTDAGMLDAARRIDELRLEWERREKV